MREVLKSFIPRQHWAASNVDIVPTVANVKQLAQWGGVGVFTAFWMIGAFSFTFRFAIFFSLSFSLSFRLRRPKTPHRPRLSFLKNFRSSTREQQAISLSRGRRVL
jgi:hypothetical protein